ncbi:MAG: DNA polymerase I [SAR324 cluster bacterium]|nr:DNA polymerase I [SAR324 cluster bacterium]
MENKLLLVDVSAYIFRAFFGVRGNFSNSEGMPTNAVFGFKNMLLHLLNTENPSHVAMVFDTPGGTFRNEIYSEYKANRSACPEDLVPQFAPIAELTELLQLPIIKRENYEADDLIGTLSKKFSKEIKVIIVSGDKDLTQLVNEDVVMLDTMKDYVFGPEQVKEKFGVGPEKIAQYLAIVGDTSDNIPGAKGIGPKTATKLFDQFGDLEGILANTDKLKGKQRENLEASIDDVRLSYELTQIVCDIPIEESLEDFLVTPPDLEPLKEFYKRMNFREDSLFKVWGVSTQAPVVEDNWDYGRYNCITTQTALDELIAKLKESEVITLDFETTNLQAQIAEIVGISFATDNIAPCYIPVAHTTFGQLVEGQIKREDLLQTLIPLFEDEQKTWIGQNIKYELMVLANYGLTLKGKIEDSMLESYLLNANSHRHGLDALSEAYLGHKMIAYKDVCGTGKKEIPFSDVALDVATRYGAEDSEATRLIHNLLRPRLKEQNLENLYLDMEIPLLRVLGRMENQGICIDVPYLAELEKDLTTDQTKLTAQIYELAGEEFNINSPKQLGDILFEKLGITEAKKQTKTGYTTNVDVLEKLAPNHKIAELLLEYRGKTKLLNTYLAPLPMLVLEKTGRIHTSFSQTTAATGRLSSKNPNLQNIPIRSLDGKKIRKAFIPSEGCFLVSADYSQIELRFLAHISEDENLIAAFNSGSDIHQETAAAIFNVQNLDEVNGEQRSAAKAINFGIIYGMGAFRLAGEIGVSNKEAKAFIDAYFARYPKIKSYMDETIEFAREHKYVETMFGRKRAIDGINSKNHMERTGAERIAINSRIQGSAADLIKIAMIELDQEFEKLDKKNRMISQVHDELVFEIEESQIEVLSKLIKEKMEGATNLKVPLLVEVGYGKNWADAH